MNDAWTPREPYVEPPRQQRKAVDLADVKVEPEAEKPAEGKREAKADGLRLLLGVANIDARLTGIEKSVDKLAKTVDKLAKTVDKLAERIEASAGRKLTVAEFDAAYEASRRAKDLQDERYEIKPTDETAGGRIKDSNYGATSTDEYNADAHKRIRRPRIMKKGRS